MYCMITLVGCFSWALEQNMIRGLPFSMYAPRGGWVGLSLLYISIAYYMQKGGGGGGPESM